MLETVEHIGTETFIEVLVLLVGDSLDEYGGIEINQGAWYTLAPVFCEVDGGKRTVGAIALTNHRHASPTTGVGIEVIGLLTCGLVFHFHQIGGKHRIPLAVNVMREDRAFVAPLAQILNGSRPHADIATAVSGVVGVVRANDIGSELARLVRILEHTGFAIRQMLPKGQIRVLRLNRKGCQQQKG